MYGIEWRKKALKELARMDRRDQGVIREAVDALATDPRPKGTKKLDVKPFEGFYRIHVTHHLRLVFEVDDAAFLVVVWKVGTRESMPW